MAHTLLEMARLLPLPGPVWGNYPMRPDDALAPARRRLRRATPLGYCRQIATSSQKAATSWLGMAQEKRAAALATLRARLRKHGLQDQALADALGAAAACASETLGMTARTTQLMAACALLDNRHAEMATGEGKTLAIGLAAAVAALSGMPVHVVTANAYLAQRDAQFLAPLFAALGLHASTLGDAMGDEARRAAYACPIVYATAKDLAFDFLRDRQAMGAARPAERIAATMTAQAQAQSQPLMRGLCMALLDEADSILLDEAEVPLILSRAAPHAARRAFLWQALALARQLDVSCDYRILRIDRMAELTTLGEQHLQQLCEGLGGPWRRPRYRRDAITMALAALHAFERDIHYVVREGNVELLDEVTGRVAPGRVWSRGLHTLVALKEGMSPPAETETVAQTTFQRFFQHYWRLCGISGTLMEAAPELHAVYGARVVRIGLHRPNRRVTLPMRRFTSQDAMFDAVATRVASLQAQGRPVLIGTDNVDDSLQLSRRLQQAGIEHQVLNALQDAQEASIVAQAGMRGRVTVATRMAGRGTDIEPDAQALASGGLHVLSCQHNPSRRLDRQLAGRAGRQGDPGSCEHWISDDRAGGQWMAQALGLPLWNRLAALAATAWIPHAAVAWAQRQQERRRKLQRRELLEQDLQWERRLAFAGRIV